MRSPAARGIVAGTMSAAAIAVIATTTVVMMTRSTPVRRRSAGRRPPERQPLSRGARPSQPAPGASNSTGPGGSSQSFCRRSPRGWSRRRAHDLAAEPPSRKERLGFRTAEIRRQPSRAGVLRSSTVRSVAAAQLRLWSRARAGSPGLRGLRPADQRPDPAIPVRRTNRPRLVRR